jgi:hypothetical protein
MALSVFPARRSHPTELGVSEPQREPPRPSHIFSFERRLRVAMPHLRRRASNDTDSSALATWRGPCRHKVSGCLAS